MKSNKKLNDKLAQDLLLYAVTDRSWLGNETLCEQVRQALEGGVTCLQLREKDLNDEDFMQEALEIRDLCRSYDVPFIINDNVEIAVACNADGVHVGQHDMAAGLVREKLGKDKILGVSVQTVEQARLAELSGADYLGVGAVFSTSTKADADAVSFADLQEICAAVRIPVVAIGGISAENIMQLAKSGICGVAVVSAIFAQSDIRGAAANLLKLTKEMVND